MRRRRATVTGSATTTRCLCDVGYAGARCDEHAAGYHDDGAGGCIDDVCLPNPCVEPNQAVCREEGGAPVCDCDPGDHPDGVGGCTDAPCTTDPCAAMGEACRGLHRRLVQRRRGDPRPEGLGVRRQRRRDLRAERGRRRRRRVRARCRAAPPGAAVPELRGVRRDLDELPLTTLSAGASCDDGLRCTEGDACDAAGICRGVVMAACPAECRQRHLPERLRSRRPVPRRPVSRGRARPPRREHGGGRARRRLVRARGGLWRAFPSPRVDREARTPDGRSFRGAAPRGGRARASGARGGQARAASVTMLRRTRVTAGGAEGGSGAAMRRTVSA